MSVLTSINQKEYDSELELFLFHVQYSFLFSNNDKTQKTCNLKTPQFHIPQENGENGARYLDAKYSRWISTDPALGEYVPLAPVNDEAKKHNQNLPGMGGLFNTVNLSLYHYAGNNPVKYTDPDGRTSKEDQAREMLYEASAFIINNAETEKEKIVANVVKTTSLLLV